MIETADPELSKIELSFVQEGNTLGTTEEVESIDIIGEFQSGEQDGPFWVIKTEGWSFDDISEVEQLINRAKKILKNAAH